VQLGGAVVTPGQGRLPQALADTIAESAVTMLARPAHRVPAEPGVDGALSQLRQDVDYLTRLLDAR
jgi:hypothetical protein